MKRDEGKWTSAGKICRTRGGHLETPIVRGDHRNKGKCSEDILMLLTEAMQKREAPLLEYYQRIHLPSLTSPTEEAVQEQGYWLMGAQGRSRRTRRLRWQ